MFGIPTPVWFILSFVTSLVVGFVLFRLMQRYFASAMPTEAGPNLFTVNTSAELLHIAKNYSLEGEENAIFLRKVRKFEQELSDEAWYHIYDSAEIGTELKDFAGEKVGMIFH